MVSRSQPKTGGRRRRQVGAGPRRLGISVAAGERLRVAGPELRSVGVEEAAADVASPEVERVAVERFAQALHVVEVDFVDESAEDVVDPFGFEIESFGE